MPGLFQGHELYLHNLLCMHYNFPHIYLSQHDSVQIENMISPPAFPNWIKEFVSNFGEKLCHAQSLRNNLEIINRIY